MGTRGVGHSPQSHTPSHGHERAACVIVGSEAVGPPGPDGGQRRVTGTCCHYLARASAGSASMCTGTPGKGCRVYVYAYARRVGPACTAALPAHPFLPRRRPAGRPARAHACTPRPAGGGGAGRVPASPCSRWRGIGDDGGGGRRRVGAVFGAAPPGGPGGHAEAGVGHADPDQVREAWRQPGQASAVHHITYQMLLNGLQPK